MQREIPLTILNSDIIFAPSLPFLMRVEMYSGISDIHAVERTVFVIPLSEILLAVQIKSFYPTALAIVLNEDFFVSLICVIRLRFRTVAILCPICFIEYSPCLLEAAPTC